jgi:hypothetical protein
MVLVRWGEPVILLCPQLGIPRQSCKIFLVDMGFLGQDLPFERCSDCILARRGSVDSIVQENL